MQVDALCDSLSRLKGSFKEAGFKNLNLKTAAA